MDAKTTGEKIAALRKEKNMTQRELAERLHVTGKAVSKWETGKNFPDLALLPALAGLLDTTVPALLDLERESPETSIAVISAISRQETRSIKWSLYQVTVLGLLTGGLLVLAHMTAATAFGRELAGLLPVMGLFLLFDSAVVLEKLIRKFSGQTRYRWPEEREETLFDVLKIQLSLWGERIRGGRGL